MNKDKVNRYGSISQFVNIKELMFSIFMPCPNGVSLDHASFCSGSLGAYYVLSICV